MKQLIFFIPYLALNMLVLEMVNQHFVPKERHRAFRKVTTHH